MHIDDFQMSQEAHLLLYQIRGSIRQGPLPTIIL